MPLADGEDRDLRAPLLGDGLDGGEEGKRRKEDEAEERDAAILVDEGNASDDAEGGGDVYTVDDAVNSLGAGWFQVLLLVVVGLCCIGEGGNATIAAFVSPALRCQWGLSTEDESLIAQNAFLGIVVGSYVWGAVADLAGRRLTLCAACLGGIASSTLAASVQQLGWMCAFFFMMGMSMGGQFTAMSYILEYVPTAWRGFYGSLLGVIYSVGVVGNAAVGWLVMPWGGWRALMVVTNLPFVIMLVLFPFVPESPHYLIVAGQHEKAKRALEWAAKLNRTKLPSGRLINSAATQQQTQGKSRFASFIKEVSRLWSRPLWRTTLLIMLIWISTTVLYNTILLLTTEVHAKEGGECNGKVFKFSEQDFKDVLVVSSAEVIGNILPVFVIDLLGRKWAMFSFSFATAAAILPLVVFGRLLNPTIPLFAARGLNTTTTGLLGIYTPEVYPTGVRGFVLGLGHTFGAFASLVSPLVAQVLYHKSGIRAAAGVLLGLLVLAMATEAGLQKETKGKPLEDTIVEEESREDQTQHMNEPSSA